MQIYYPYSDYLKAKYGEKVYKLPVNVPGTCPNRDGTLGTGGCAYCAGIGAGFESLSDTIPVSEQLTRNKSYIGSKYHAKKFIAYFQNYTGTYLPVEQLEELVLSALIDDVVAVNIATRPDCVTDKTIAMLFELKDTYHIDICIELGLQTANDDTLKKINRGHDTAQFIDTAIRLKQAGLTVSVHVIPDLPYDNMGDVIRTSRLISVLHLDGVKLHSLYIAKNSLFESLYQTGKLALLNETEYIARVIAFLEHLSPNIYVERLIGRIPEADSVTANFNRSWWAVRDAIVNQMAAAHTYQGIKCVELGGSAHNKRYGTRP